MKKVFLLKILIFIFIIQTISCVSTQEKALNNSEYNELRIEYDFYLKEKRSRTPVIQLEINNELLNFECDTGATNSFLYKSGVKKIVKDFSEWENNSIQEFLDDVNSSNKDQMTLVEAKQYYRNLAKKGGGYTKIPISFMQNENEYVVTFSYVNTNRSLDGVLGLDFFKQLDNIVFDYCQKKICFNSTLKDWRTIPLEVLSEDGIDSLYIDCLLNNEVETCLIDTGAYYCIIRQDFQKDRNKIYDLITAKKPKGNFINKIKTLRISDVELENIDFYYSISSSLNCSDFVRDYYKKHTGLGFNVFDNHIIQIDFKNMQFSFE